MQLDGRSTRCSTDTEIMFQFHIGAIRWIERERLCSGGFGFNSILVQLDGDYDGALRQFIFVSIPYWCN